MKSDTSSPKLPISKAQWGKVMALAPGKDRQYFPKSMSLSDVSQVEVDDVVYRLNHRLRKYLGYRTPHEVFYNLPPEPIALRLGALCT